MSQMNCLLLDSLARILANPSSVHGRHRFESLFVKAPAELQAEALAPLSAPTLASGLPGFLRALMLQIDGFDPGLIFFVGLYEPLLLPLYQQRPVLALGTHAFAPVVPADAWLCADAAPGSVMTRPHQEDIGSLLAASDIYINPPRIGGGFSVAEAMAASLPVVALHGTDGGNKLGEMAALDEEGYFLKRQILLESEASRTSTGAQLHAVFEQTLSLEHSHRSLDAAIAKTLELYQRRSAAS